MKTLRALLMAVGSAAVLTMASQAGAATCEDWTDCVGNQDCLDGWCHDMVQGSDCTVDGDCGDGERCSEQVCWAPEPDDGAGGFAPYYGPCDDDSMCSDWGGRCVGGECSYDDTGCSSDADCQDGTCYQGECQYQDEPVVSCESDADCPGGLCNMEDGSCYYEDGAGGGGGEGGGEGGDSGCNSDADCPGGMCNMEDGTCFYEDDAGGAGGQGTGGEGNGGEGGAGNGGEGGAGNDGAGDGSTAPGSADSTEEAKGALGCSASGSSPSAASLLMALAVALLVMRRPRRSPSR